MLMSAERKGVSCFGAMVRRSSTDTRVQATAGAAGCVNETQVVVSLDADRSQRIAVVTGHV